MLSEDSQGTSFIENSPTVQRVDALTREIRDLVRVSTGQQRAQLMQNWSQNLELLDAQRESLARFMVSYRSLLETLAGDFDEETVDQAYKGLRLELEVSEQEEFLRHLASFWSDLRDYRRAPDMDQDTLLQLAIVPG